MRKSTILLFVGVTNVFIVCGVDIALTQAAVAQAVPTWAQLAFVACIEASIVAAGMAAARVVRDARSEPDAISTERTNC
jgi:hypothetical protein